MGVDLGPTPLLVELGAASGRLCTPIGRAEGLEDLLFTGALLGQAVGGSVPKRIAGTAGTMPRSGHSQPGTS